MGVDRYDIEPDLADAVHWAGARTLADLGDLTARWLEGDISYQPGYNAAGPDPETTGLIPLLAAANRAGYVTTFSQPGEPIENGCGQRAAVEGFCAADTADRVQDAVVGTDLVVLALFPGATGELAIPVTMREDAAHTWIGTPLDPDTIVDYYTEACHRQAIGALCLAWQVSVFDPVWGRNDLLWGKLGDILGLGASF